MFFTQISQIARISPHRCARGGVCHTDSTDSTDFSASRCLQGLARTYSPCPAGRDLVDLVDYFPSGIFSGCGYFNLVDFLQGIAGCARWIGLSLARGGHTDSSFCHTDITDSTDYFASLRSRVFMAHRYHRYHRLFRIAALAEVYVTQKAQKTQKLSHRCARVFFFTQKAQKTQKLSHCRARVFFHTDITDTTDYSASLGSRWREINK